MQTFLTIVDIIGIIGFGASGALVAIDRETDFFGVLFLSVITAFGGGAIRDVLLCRPPVFFTTLIDVAVCVAVGLIAYFLAFFFKDAYIRNEATVAQICNVFDAVGLGVFAVFGVQISIEAGSTDPFKAIFLGMTTCIGGSIMRDLMLDTVPGVLRKHIYAIAAILAASVYYILYMAGAGTVAATIFGFFSGFLLRMAATVFKWDLPPAIRFGAKEKKENKKESCEKK